MTRKFKKKESKVRVPATKKEKMSRKDDNPLNLVRSVPQGRLNHETHFEFIKRCLLKYNEIHGNMLVTEMYLIPWNDIWAEEMWGVRLGKVVSKIRANRNFRINKDELTAIGFDYSKQTRRKCWDIIKIALETYKKLNGNLSMNQRFVIPSESHDWPESVWGFALGMNLYNIRRFNTYADHREELIEMGVTYISKHK